jgi:hypothetical protein
VDGAATIDTAANTAMGAAAKRDENPFRRKFINCLLPSITLTPGSKYKQQTRSGMIASRTEVSSGGDVSATASGSTPAEQSTVTVKRSKILSLHSRFVPGFLRFAVLFDSFWVFFGFFGFCREPVLNHFY